MSAFTTAALAVLAFQRWASRGRHEEGTAVGHAIAVCIYAGRAIGPGHIRDAVLTQRALVVHSGHEQAERRLAVDPAGQTRQRLNIAAIHGAEVVLHEIFADPGIAYSLEDEVVQAATVNG